MKVEAGIERRQVAVAIMAKIIHARSTPKLQGTKLTEEGGVHCMGKKRESKKAAFAAEERLVGIFKQEGLLA